MCFRPGGVSKPQRCACGTLNPPTAKACRKCGAELIVEEPKFECPRCGALNEMTAEKCVACGLTKDEVAKYL